MKDKVGHVLTIVLATLLLPCALTLLLGGRMQEIYRKIQDETAYISVRSGQGICSMNLEEYVIGVTAAQIPPEYEAEAIKAQMVVTRTNLYRGMEEEKVWDGEYLSLSQLESMGAADKFLKAEKETRGQILTWEGEPAMASFHALSAGQTRSGAEAFQTEEYPYLASKACPTDERAEDFETIVQIAPEWSGMEIIKRDSAGYVQQLRVGDTILSGEEFRNLLGLPSAHFDVSETAKGLFLTIRGVGHGLGMSQFAANQMAMTGKSYKEILGYFFEDVRLESK